jgi:hypothetical protein
MPSVIMLTVIIQDVLLSVVVPIQHCDMVEEKNAFVTKTNAKSDSHVNES